jgi:protein TonB
MRRWIAALSVSFALHSLLFLLPGVDVTHADPPGAFRVVLHGAPRISGGSAEALPIPKEEPSPESARPMKKEEKTTRKEQPAAVRPSKPEKKSARSDGAKKVAAPKAKSEPEQAPRSQPKKTLDEPLPGAVARRGADALSSETAAGTKMEARGGAGAISPTGGVRGEPVDVETLRILSRTPPEYPLFSRRRREEGVVHLLLTIRSGRVLDVAVSTSSGFSRLDDAAVHAAKLWTFDAPGEIRARASIVFRLR